MVLMTMTCRDCGEPFAILPGEAQWPEQRGLQPYRRCPRCRAKRRGKKSRAAAARRGPPPAFDDVKVERR